MRVDRDRAEQSLYPAPELGRRPAGGGDSPGVGNRDRPIGTDGLIGNRSPGAAGLAGVTGKLRDPATVARRESLIRARRGRRCR